MLEVSKSHVGAAESGASGLDVRVLARAAAVAHLRLALLDRTGQEVPPVSSDGVRDMANRRFPAHLDTRHGDDDWWHGPERYSRAQPWYTFDRSRDGRDSLRRRDGTPDDHQLAQAGDSPYERALARRHAAARARAEELQRRFLAGEIPHLDDSFSCTCPPACEELDDRTGPPVHALDCTCRCDVA